MLRYRRRYSSPRVWRLRSNSGCSRFTFLHLAHIYIRRRLQADLKTLGLHVTDLQRAKFLERRNRLQRKIDAWTMAQQYYTPAAAAIRRGNGFSLEDTYQPEAVELLLPSQLVGTVNCDPRLLHYEWELRYVQAFETLDELRRHLILRTQMLQSKDRYIRGQHMNTRGQTLVKKVQAKINVDALRYRTAYNALVRLKQPGGLQNVNLGAALVPLRDSDIQGINKNEDKATGEGHRNLSWIWKVVDASTGDANMQECTYINTFSPDTPFLTVGLAIRIEWCKARARAHRWQEECALLMEEMRRVLAFFHWQSDWWTKKAESVLIAERLEKPAQEPDKGTVGKNKEEIRAREGLRAYALRQAALRQTMLARFSHTWRDVAVYVRLGAGVTAEKFRRVEFEN